MITKAGDIIAIPLEECLFGIFAVTYVFSYFKSCIAVGVFPHLLAEPVAPSRLDSPFALYPMFMGKQPITLGLLPRIGHITLPDHCQRPGEMIVATDVFRGDQFVRSATEDDRTSLPCFSVCGHIALQFRIREYFKLPT
jgi:hypothetical protein